MNEITSIQELTNNLTKGMVTARHWHDASFINMPMVYPSGSRVTVRLSYAKGGIKVSDSGFAYREADFFGAGRSFGQTASSVAELYKIEAGKRSLFVDVPSHDLQRALFDVSAASHLTAQRIASRVAEDTEATLSEALVGRLNTLFHDDVKYEGKITGSSSTEWEVSAIATLDGHRAVFQAVSKYPSSIYKASTAFHDLANLDNPPTLISVVANRFELGSSLSLLSQAGHVIEVGQPDDVFLKAAS